ncbi:hypothetical protein RY27_22675 [Litorilinea aerophila]|nr:hypothetical protein RY27_22675 [Litorilinea aerophila]
MSILKRKQPLILVVEDNPDVKLAICDILEAYGYQVRSATNGIEALEILRQIRPDVILCDIMMPGMDGYSLLQHTRSDTELRTLPFIFLTGLTSTVDQRRAKDIGVEDYLTKPFNNNDLILAIRNALRRHQIMEEEMQRQMDLLRNQIVGILQHEFRTPLTFVMGWAEYLQDTLAEEPELDLENVRTSAAAILEGGRRLQRLIESFLLLSDLQNRRLQPEEVEVVNALDLWREAQVNLQEKIQETGMEVQILPENADAQVSVDPHLLINALTRLLDNALAYGREDSRHVWLSVVTMPRYIGLRIQDEGWGIPEARIPHLLHPFSRNQQEEWQVSSTGVGLSLALVHHIALSHGGSLEIESTVGEGSTFTLWLPDVISPPADDTEDTDGQA